MQRWIINTLAVLMATYFVKGIHYNGPIDLCVATLVLGVLNAFVRPLLMLLSAPLLLVTLGLFMLVINAILLLLVSWLLRPNFYVDGFWTAFWGALVIAIISLLLNSLTGSGDVKTEVRRGKAPGPKRGDDDGPVIDI